MDFKDKFTTPYEQFAQREGQGFTVVRPLTAEEADIDFEECGPMWLIRFEDGFEIAAWPEEVEQGMEVNS